MTIAASLLNTLLARSTQVTPDARKALVLIAVDMADDVMVANMNKATPVWKVEP